MDAWQGDALEDNRDVIGVAEPPVGAGADRRQPWHHDDPWIPPLTQRADAPPTKRLAEYGEAEQAVAHGGGKFGTDEPSLGQASGEQACMKHDHEGPMPLSMLHTALSEAPLEIGAPDDELGETLEPSEPDEACVQKQAHQ